MELRRDEGILRVVESASKRMFVAGWAGGLGCFGLIGGLLTSKDRFVFLVVGLLFLSAGAVLAWTAETRTLTIVHNLPDVTVEYLRVIDGKRWIRRLPRSNLVKVDFLEPRGNHGPTIYLDTTFNEQIEIGTRTTGANRKAPLVDDAAEIAKCLTIPLNVVSMKGLDPLRNLYTPRDPMAVMFQRPTQEQLDQWAEQ